MFNHPELVEYLIIQGANVESEDKDGRSVILLASARAAWKAVLVLIRLGSDVHHQDNCSRNLLHHIVISGGNLDQFTGELNKVCYLSIVSLLYKLHPTTCQTFQDMYFDKK